MAVALREQGDQNIGPRYLVAAGRLDMNGSALDDPLEARGRQRLARCLGDDPLQAIVDERLEIVAQPVDVDTARFEDGRRVLVFGHGQKQVLQRRIFVTPLAGETESAMERLLEVL